ncbi:MAG: 50S ribosomal protein L9 [Clostridiales bacterium]|nr:50S ribosomal protein L9 [Clostridiales bacterium]
MLLENIKTLGNKFDIKDVKDGYANNYLFKKKLAKKLTKDILHEIESKKRSADFKKEKENREYKLICEKIDGKDIIIYAKSGIEGKLFGAITQKEIAKKILDDFNLDIDKKKVILEESIKTLGKRQIDIKFSNDIIARIYVLIKEKS